MKPKVCVGLSKFFKKRRMKFNWKNFRRFLCAFLIYTGLLVLFRSFGTYSVFVINNIEFLSFLMPFFLLMLAWLIVAKNKGLVIASCAIIITILFFIFTGSEAESEGINTIQATNIHNCRIINNNINFLTGVENNSRGFVLNYFATEPYYQNFDLIYRKAGLGGGNEIQRAIFEMEGINNFIRMNMEKATNLGSIEHTYNEEIIKWSNKIKPVICRRLFYKSV